ncbi:Serine/threonine-protein kinase [Apostasia shenzhenica]|uniref:Serine/threonine-protein kinase n=1 Tax=Apostasia shenzhenica TaxID=1088818 RepID=A0A2I0BGC7_9ASPA|nr:Serine/threonine-protein kinase [Apostasia shenzhenica]
MDSYYPAIASSAPPPVLHSRIRHGQIQRQHHRPHGSTIVLPIVAVGVLLACFSILLLLCRAKGKSNGGSSSFRKSNSFDERMQVSRCSSNLRANGSGYSPEEVRSCMYRGKMGYAPQIRSKGPKGGQVFTYKELELATEGFSGRNIIADGGFGVVYRGKLKDGTVVAIKLFHVQGKLGEREFRMEVDLLSRLNSKFLVGLLGYCADQHHRLLVFEYMPNGCLQQHLHPTLSKEGPATRPLDWRTRLRIALDCAKGLEFLHEHSVPAVIHRDFKCSNILLDHNFGAKVSDFGMAKTGSEKVNGQVQTRVLGTSGYVAPEYASSGKLTTKSDVYSYGVVLLELLTGRVPVDTTRAPGEHVLVTWALPRLTNRDKVVEMVDPALQGQYSRKELVQVAAIAAVCVQAEADYRPLITDVVQSLIPLAKSMNANCPATTTKFKVDNVSIMMP